MSAISALKGYRTQFLFSLSKILSEYDKNYIFRPEGEYEDLDILDNQGEYLEIIQVKNKNSTLTFADLFSKKDSLFKRASRLLKSNENTIIKVVSFGAVSDELINKTKLERKLKKKGFHDGQINSIIRQFSIPEVVDERELELNILKKLKEIQPFTDSKILLELLLFSIYVSAEKQIEINGKKMVSEFEKISKFISEAKSFKNQFGNSIIPFTTKSIDNVDKQRLEDEFYYGISAKYEHILFDLDIIRGEKISSIKQAFRRSNIVFIHGASGQGKSTLAYRYLHDSLNSNTVYELKISQNLNEVFETISTLNALSKGLNFPVTLYLDIKPQDIYWNNILNELSSKNNLQFLVTIRQEDWNRTSLGVDYDFEDIELFFNKKEAEIIYDSLSKHKTDLKFTSFKESWIAFGNKGLLLEYIYLINQGDKLKNRLQNQVARLEKEKKVDELRILRFVCLSDSYNSKINFIKLVELLNIDNVLSDSHIKLLEKEYLLKYSDDKKYLTGLHPIRSKLLCEILFDDNDYVFIEEYIEKIIPLINEQDLHSFLLNCFENYHDIDKLVSILSQIEVLSGQGYVNIYNALLWKGAHDYVNVQNKDVLDDAYALLKGSWWLFLVIDFSGMRAAKNQYDLIKILEKDEEQQKERIAQIEELNSRLSDSNNVFNYCLKWFDKLTEINVEPKSSFEWESLGEFLFWVGYLNIQIDVRIDQNLIVAFFENKIKHIEEQSTVLLGLKKINYFQSQESLRAKLEEEYLKNLRAFYKIYSLKTEDKIIKLKYFFDITDNLQYEKNSIKSKSFDSILVDESDLELPSQSTNIFHERTINILNNIRKGFPYMKKYSINGIGYNYLGLESDYDPTSKNIPVENLPLKFLVRLNGLIINLYNYESRLDSWEEYIEHIIEKREKQFEVFKSIKTGLITYFKNQDKGIKFFIDKEPILRNAVFEFKNHPLPKIISDRWCYYGDSTNDNVNDIKVAFSMSSFKKFTSAKNDYFFSCRNFVNNSFTEIGNTLKRLNNKSEEIENDNLRNITEINLVDAFANIIKFNEEFESKFEKYVDTDRINKLYSSEINILTSLITIWKAFLYSPYRYQPSISKLSSIQFEKTKLDLRVKLYKQCTKLFKETDFFRGLKEDAENKSLIFLVNANREDYVDVLDRCFYIITEVFGNMHHTSLKKALVDFNYEKVTFVPLFFNNPITDKFLELPIWRIDSINEKINAGHEFASPFEIFSFPEEFDNQILIENELKLWNETIPEIKLFEEISGLCSSLKYISIHLKQIKEAFNNCDTDGQILLNEYVVEIADYINSNIILPSKEKISVIQLSLSKIDETEPLEVAISLVSLTSEFIEAIEKVNIPDILIGDKLEELFLINNKSEESYEAFAESMILNYNSKYLSIEH